MVVTVTYEGVALVAGTKAQEEADGLFLPCLAPMPVGTVLLVEPTGGPPRTARVTRVSEGKAGTGMALVWAEPVATQASGPSSDAAPPAQAPETTDARSESMAGSNGHAVAETRQTRSGRRKRRR